jgi:hypothetical protein
MREHVQRLVGLLGAEVTAGVGEVVGVLIVAPVDVQDAGVIAHVLAGRSRGGLEHREVVILSGRATGGSAWLFGFGGTDLA